MHTRILILTLILILVAGCSEDEEMSDSTAAPETTAAVTDEAATPDPTDTPQQATITNINNLLDQAETALDDDDFPNARPFLNGAASLINDDLTSQCAELSSAEQALNEAADADNIDGARTGLDEARSIINDCGLE